MTGAGRLSAVTGGFGLTALLLISACGRAAVPPATDAPLAQSPATPVADVASEPGTAPSSPALVLTSEGYGPLRIGMTLADVVTTYGPDSDPGSVGGPEPEVCDQFRPVRAPEGLLVMIEDGRLTRISLYRESRVATDRGLRLGASAAQVRAAYGGAIQAEPHHYQDPPGEYLTTWSKGGLGRQGVAEPGSLGIRYEIGQDGGRVEVIHAGGPSIQYVEGCL